MAAMRGPRLQVGSAAWVAAERSSALQIADSEVEEFSYSARNELEWLNEHMAGIFNENETNIAEAFKTPGKLRGKTPRTIRKQGPVEARVPLSDVFGSTPISAASHFAQPPNRLQSPLIKRGSPSFAKVASPRVQVYSAKPYHSQTATQDSGYHGSQDLDAVDMDYADENDVSTQDIHLNHANFPTTTTVPLRNSPSRTVVVESPDKTFRTAREEQTTRVVADVYAGTDVLKHTNKGNNMEERDESISPSLQPTRTTPSVSPAHVQHDLEPTNTRQAHVQHSEATSVDNRSPSDGSSPIRPVVRKSSLNFATLPAREPLTAGKSGGARVSRTSHLDHNRTSYYSRPTGGKSLGNYGKRDASEDEDHDEMDVDEQESHEPEDIAVNHNKTYTQRLQDQINMLGKSQPGGSRPSKSIPNGIAPHTTSDAPALTEDPKSPSPKKAEIATTPGAFPEEEEDDDDWIDPPSVGPVAPMAASKRPSLPKSHTADIMEGIHSKESVGGPEFTHAEGQQAGQSPPQGSPVHERPSIYGHGKAASVSALPATLSASREGSPLKQTVSVSNPYLGMATVPEKGYSPTPSKSPSRNFRDSPLKQVKNKLSSILKSSKGLLASSAALSAEGKSSMLSPSTTRLGIFPGPSSESIVSKSSLQPGAEAESSEADRQGSPTRPVARRTRASVEREKEEKRRDKEAKHFADQMDKLDKAREQEREKARVFSKEQEKMAALEKQVAAKKEVEKSAPKETPKPTRSSPRKAQPQEESGAGSVEHDVEMADAPSAMPPPSVPRSAGPSQGARNKEIKRPMRPGKETQLKPKQAPTVIRVNTGSQQQHPQYNPASSTISSNYSDHGSSTNSQPQLAGKASKPNLGAKPSLQSLKSSAPSSSRPKALDLAARKKEQDERDAQRRRDAKAEIERKRAAAQEEQRKQEQLRRQEAERLRQKERDQAEAKKNAQRQAAIERAKQTRAPPPAVRSQPNGPPDYSLSQSQRGDGPPTRPQSRMNSGIHKSQEDPARPVNALLSNASKSTSKRPLGQDANEDGQARRPPSRGGPAYQTKDAKRRRTSDGFGDELEMDNPPNIKGPPVRPSGGFKKDLQAKAMFSNGYSNVPQSATRDLFKATVTAQHTTQTKAAHPLDMAQISKGAIPFAPNSNPAGPSYKTPARPGPVNGAKSVAKSAQRSSPRFQNGESIELPEIQTDDEDEDDEEEHAGAIAPWADSPDLRRALMRQETMDPSQIFGPPAPLNMEEVFSKSKEKWHKFRARTSSANWSGSDRLTEDDIRKDLAARDKMRREGGWSYEMSKDMV